MRSGICSSTQAVGGGGGKRSWMREYGRCLSDGPLKEKMCQGNVATSRSELEIPFDKAGGVLNGFMIWEILR